LSLQFKILEIVSMRSFRSTWLINGSLFMAAAAAFAGCMSEDSEEIKTDLVITPSAALVTSSTTKSFDFGASKMTLSKSQVFTVSNISNSNATITGVTSADLGLIPPFSASAPAAEAGIEPCTAGQTLLPGQGCLISATFSPTVLGAAEVTMNLTFTGSDAKAAPETATLKLKGQGLPAPAPILVLSVGAALSTSTTLTPYNFGTVGVLTTKSKVFTVSNTGDAGAAFQGLGSADLGLSAPYSATQASAEANLTACADSQVLAPGQGCLINVTVSPTTLGYFETNLQVSYVGPNAPDVAQTKLKLLATAVLDCSISPELSASRADGVTAAQARMVLEAAQGTADGKAAGEALTYVDGQTAGYNKGYSDGYNQGYNGPDGYNKGYPVGYNEGYIRGLHDVASCNQGTNAGQSAGATAGGNAGKADGYTDGYDDGFVIGAGTGYNDGYDDGRYTGAADGSTQGANEGTTAGATQGYDDGQDDGYPIGYADGYDAGTCSATAGTSSSAKLASTSQLSKTSGTTAMAKLLAPALPADTDWAGQCYNQGFTVTYNPNTYNNAYATAYAAAKAANQQYQAGYAEAYPRGKAAGIPVGTTAGYNAGKAAGDAAGFAVGTAEEYDRCYDNAYPTAYSNAYTSAYNYWYNTGRTDGIDDAYDAAYLGGYNTGYDVGFDSTYNNAFDNGFNAAYSSHYTTGWDDGYDSGYYDGYDDAEYDTCENVTSVMAFTLSSRVTQSEALVKPTAPAPTAIPTPTGKSLKTKRALYGKRVSPKTLQSKPSELKGYGTSWKLDQHLTTDTNPPQSMTDKWTSDQLKEFGSMRDLAKSGSLRQFLRSKNQSENPDGQSVKRHGGRPVSPKLKAKKG
jgi:flagellar biosynthesis/type III secretory pathway protein FliH